MSNLYLIPDGCYNLDALYTSDTKLLLDVLNKFNKFLDEEVIVCRRQINNIYH